MNQNLEKTILVVDDEKEIRHLLQECLEMEGYRVLTAANGPQAMELLPLQPDMILLDVNMPVIDGYLFCEKIRNYVSCPILFLTARTQEQDRITGFRAGGDDYVSKPFGMEELLARIEAHLRREERMARNAEGVQKDAVHQDNGSRHIMDHPANVSCRTTEPAPVWWEGDLEIDLAGRRILCGEQDLGLTKTEFNIVEMLLMNKGRVLGKEQIYERVRGYDGNADANIIMEHIRRIRRKIGVYSKQEYIVTVWGVGYRWNG